jgi:opacity protein-like surface antigen
MNTNRRLLTIITALALLLAAAPAYAQGASQTQPSAGFGIGVLGGVTFTTVSTEENQFNLSTNGGAGVILGLWFGGNRDGRVGFMGELSYVLKGVTVGDGGDKVEARNHYVEVPLLLRVNIGARSKNKPSLYLLGGPAFDIKIKAEENSVDANDSYEGLDIGLMFGVGFEVVRIGIEGRYTWGINSVLATDAAAASGFGKTRYNTLQIIGKIRFN